VKVNACEINFYASFLKVYVRNLTLMKVCTPMLYSSLKYISFFR